MKSNKAELVNVLAEITGLTKKVVTQVVDAYPKAVHELLEEVGDSVNVKGFLKFERVLQPARTGHHPKTLEPLEIPEKEVNKVRLSAAFK